MDSLPSGSHDEVVKLLQIETETFSLYIQGKPYHPTVETLHLHRTDKDVFVDAKLSVHPHSAMCQPESIRVYSPHNNSLVDYLTEQTAPLFYETQSYTLVVLNKKDNILSFHHDNLELQKAIKSHDNKVLSGTLKFGSEVGYTDLHIMADGAPALTINLEIFPAKLDYKTDYVTILNDVNEQIYNLSFDFMKKTYHLSGLVNTQNQTLTEYFTILNYIFKQLVSSVERIQNAPHHKLEQELRIRDAALVKRAGRTNLKFLTRNPRHLIADANDGTLTIHGQSYHPDKLIETKRRLSYDTSENRFLKWMLERIDRKLRQVDYHTQYSERKLNPELHIVINKMRSQIRRLLQIDFLKEAGVMRQVSVTLVLQMAHGYRDTYRIYLMLMKGLAIQSDLLHISLKDLALLYEYWCFLKIHHLLSKKYKLVSQDVIKVNHTGLFVTLDRKRSAKMIYENPSTNERFELFYNNATISTKEFPTLSQRPDNVLTITKSDGQHKKRIYRYVFDAKYRMNPAYKETPYLDKYKMPGPEEEDINTMHRYRDSMVYKEKGIGPYERGMFGAYVLFPFGDEERYKEHQFYKSIELINVGAIPFLPNATGLMESFLDELIIDSPEKAYERSTRPTGTEEYYLNKLSGKNVIVVKATNNIDEIKNSLSIEVPLSIFKNNRVLTQIKRIALLQTKEHFSIKELGIHYYGIVSDWQVIRSRDESGEENLLVKFAIGQWVKVVEPIIHGAYHLQECLLTSSYLLDRVSSLSELRIEEEEDLSKWRELRRMGHVIVELDHEHVDLATSITRISLREGLST